ncbi:MAG: T9SS type A sorting domain-containing protein [Flavobacteriales bacterium]|nr:T9SS type A sorting domain-containing protein [Flavobacteriales bacterium]
MRGLKRILLFLFVTSAGQAFSQVPGCTDPSACNFDASATEDDGTCDYSCYGCTEPTANNYNPNATVNDGSCLWDSCVPYELVIEEACLWDSQTGDFITRVAITPSISGVCYLEEICWQQVGGGGTGCIDLPAIGEFITDGETVIIPLLAGGVYSFTATTFDGTSDPVEIAVNCYDNQNACGNPYAVNYDPEAENTFELACIYDEFICDCAGTQHNIGVLIWLGDGFYDEGTTSYWYGVPVDFTCNLWGWDCGDGGINHDPYDTCLGELPPNNGCAAPACTPLIMSFEQGECTYSDSLGYRPSFDVTFTMNGPCEVTDLNYRVNSGEWQEIDLTDLNITSDLSFTMENTIADGNYQFSFETSAESVSPYFYWNNGNCYDENTICDCSDNVYDIGVLDRLGDGNLDFGTSIGEPSVNFNCLKWGYDCGDAGVDADPIGVCEGNLPPNNGCMTFYFGCDDETACNYNAGVNFNDGSCDYETCLGCMDPTACNWDITATQDDGTCDYESCIGCTDPTACNYEPDNTEEDGSCTYDCQGCMNPDACNFDPLATENDDSCHFDCYGCTDTGACNYNPDATIDNGSCNNDCIGCMDSGACNYDPFATIDSGNCEFITCLGCTDPGACNFDSSASIDNGQCNYSCLGCTDPIACNFDPTATILDASCVYDCLGCTDEEACNYNPDATVNDNSCDFSCFGCTDPDACNYSAVAIFDDGSCQLECIGCLDPEACNYDEFAVVSDGNCDYTSCLGCTIPTACNYDSEATVDDNSCDFGCYGCIDPLACNYNEEYTIDNGTCDYESCLGCTDTDACNYDEIATQNDGTCEYVTCQGCTDPTAFNYDVTSLIDDGSCVYECVGPQIDWSSYDCEETSGNLYVVADVTDMGNAGPWTLINNINSYITVLDQPNEYVIGPFAEDDVVVCTMISTLYSSCFESGPAIQCSVNVEELEVNQVDIFPVPAQDILNVSSREALERISIYDERGREVLNDPALNDFTVTLNIGDLASGYYVVTCQTASGVIRKHVVITD